MSHYVTVKPEVVIGFLMPQLFSIGKVLMQNHTNFDLFKNISSSISGGKKAKSLEKWEKLRNFHIAIFSTTP